MKRPQKSFIASSVLLVALGFNHGAMCTANECSTMRPRVHGLLPNEVGPREDDDDDGGHSRPCTSCKDAASELTAIIGPFCRISCDDYCTCGIDGNVHYLYYNRRCADPAFVLSCSDDDWLETPDAEIICKNMNHWMINYEFAQLRSFIYIGGGSGALLLAFCCVWCHGGRLLIGSDANEWGCHIDGCKDSSQCHCHGDKEKIDECQGQKFCWTIMLRGFDVFTDWVLFVVVITQMFPGNVIYFVSLISSIIGTILLFPSIASKRALMANIIFEDVPQIVITCILLRNTGTSGPIDTSEDSNQIAIVSLALSLCSMIYNIYSVIHDVDSDGPSFVG